MIFLIQPKNLSKVIKNTIHFETKVEDVLGILLSFNILCELSNLHI